MNAHDRAVDSVLSRATEAAAAKAAREIFAKACSDRMVALEAWGDADCRRAMLETQLATAIALGDRDAALQLCSARAEASELWMAFELAEGRARALIPILAPTGAHA